MRNSRRHYFGADAKARIEIIPMIDIMMFLLVFFMIITLKMIEGAGITNPPRRKSCKPPRSPSASRRMGASILKAHRFQSSNWQRA